MIKLFLVVIIAGLVYVGMNWEQVSGKVETGLDTAEEVKSKAVDLKDQAQDTLDDIHDKVGETKNKLEDMVDKAK